MFSKLAAWAVKLTVVPDSRSSNIRLPTDIARRTLAAQAPAPMRSIYTAVEENINTTIHPDKELTLTS